MSNHRSRKSQSKSSTTSQSSTPKALSKGYYEIDQIVDKLDLSEICNQHQILYKIRWPDTWEPVSNLRKSQEVVEAFERNGAENSGTRKVREFNENDKYYKGENEWVVERILDKRVVRGKIEYLVQWQDTWEVADDINRPDLLEEFEKNLIQSKAGDINKNNANSTTGPFIETRSLESIDEFQLVDVNARKTERTLKVRSNGFGSTIQEITEIGTTVNDELVFVARWADGVDACIPTKVANLECPAAVIAFYEKHIQFE